MSARHNHARPTSPWPSRSSSSLSEALLTTNTSTSVSSSLSNNWWTPSSQPCQPFGSAVASEAVGVAVQSVTGAVLPLLGLQRLAGNAFSLRQVPWGSSAEAAPLPAQTTHSPRYPTQPAAGNAPAVQTTTTTTPTPTTSSEAAKAQSYITPNTSPRAAWPALARAPVPLDVTSRDTNAVAQYHSPHIAPAVLSHHPQHQQQQQQLSHFLAAQTQSKSLPVSSRRQRRRAAAALMASQSPAAVSPPTVQTHTQDAVATHSHSTMHVGVLDDIDVLPSPPFRPMPHGMQEGGGILQQHAQTCHVGSQVRFSDTVRSCPDASAATPLHLPARHPPWRSVGQPPLSNQTECGTSPVLNGTTSNFASYGGLPRSLQLPPPPDQQRDAGGTEAAQCSPATQLDALRSLFQQYLAAQRALEPVLRQLHVPPHRYLPLSVQESVLEQVQEFAARLDVPTHSHISVHQQPAERLVLGSAASVDSLPTLHKRDSNTPRPPAVLRRSDAVEWDAILPFLAAPPIGVHATLRAVGPGLRRRLEQHTWSWILNEVRMAVCPFVVENGDEAHVRDAYARLDGRERQYVGSVPVARRTPLTVPRQARAAGEWRVLDGSVLLDCERQTLLLDRAWREGWLHRRTCSHLRFLSPVFADPGSLRFLHRNPSRIHVDGVIVDVLRPRRSQHGGGSGSAIGGGADGLSGPPEVEDIAANTVSRAGLTPPPPPMLDSRPTAALSVTRKLLGDAVSAISRERARSADASSRAQLSRRLTSGSPSNANAAAAAAAAAANVEKALESSLLSSSQLEDGHAKERRCAGGGSGQGPRGPTQSHRHPYFRHESLPVVMEDVNGTTHIFCTRATAMDSGVMCGLLRGWLQHHHRLRRQPIYTSAADFLLVADDLDKDGAAAADYDDVDYIICTTTPTTAEMTALVAAAKDGASLPSSRHTSPRGKRTRGKAVDAGVVVDEDKAGGALGPVPLACDPEHWGCLAVDGSEAPRKSPCNPVQRLVRARLQEWQAKRENVVYRMNCVDPPWLMLGDATGPQPRPLALHLTERHIPWLARQLCPDSDSGGLVDLQELHMSVVEALLPPAWVSAWQWCMSILRNRKNLLVVSIVAAPTASPLTLEAAETTAVPAASGSSDAVAGPTAALFMDAIQGIASLQVLDLHGITGDAAMALFHGVDEAGEVSSYVGDGLLPTRLARLRDLYLTVRRSHSAGASPRSAYTGEVTLSALVFPSLQVLWFDAPNLRRLSIDRLLVLRELHLVSDSALHCSALHGVEELPFLEVLHMERAVIDDCAFLGSCRALRELLLHACRISASLQTADSDGGYGGWGGGEARVEELHGVERAPMLETLSLCYTEEIKHLSNFARCRSLRRVLLTRCNGINSSSIVGFERLPHLELLALEYTRVSGLSHFAKAPALRVLRVDGCKRVLRSSVMGLEMAPRLTELSLQDTNVSTVANFGGGCMALHSLDLSGCRHLDVDGLQGVQALPELEVLSLSHTPITDVNFLADCLKLTTLYVEGCTALLPTALEDLRSAPVLRRIIANGCTSLTRVGQLGRCRPLEVLSVSGATALTTAGVQGIERSSRLGFLDLSGTAVDSLRFLSRGCRGLRCLSVRGCPRFTRAEELHGVEELPQLETFNMENLRVTGRLDFLTLSTSLLYVSFSGCAALTEDDVRALHRSDITTSIP